MVTTAELATERAVAEPSTRHPVRVVAALALLAALAQLWWVSSHRGFGGFGVDETGYLATVLRFDAAWSGASPGDLASTVMSSPVAPVVPLLALPFVGVFGRSVTGLMAVQAAMYFLGAVGVALLVSKLSTARSAVVAGIVFLGMPVNVVMARYVQFASAVVACLTLALVAVLSSDRGHDRRRMVLAGAAVGVMTLTRSMAIALVPVVMVALAVEIHRDRRAAVNVAWSGAACLLVAAPWWIANWESAGAYLFRFGYGEGTGQIERIPVALRIPVRLGLAMLDVRPLLFVVAVVVTVSSTVALRRRVASRRWAAGTPVPWSRQDRATVAVGAGLAAGVVILLSSSNSGSWFQAPLEALALVLLCAVAGRIAGTWERRGAVAASVIAVMNLAFISVWTPGTSVPMGGVTLSAALFGGTEHVQAIDFEEIDPRFAVTSSWSVRRDAEREWAAATTALATEVRALVPDRRVETVIGELRLLNASTLVLEHERAGDRSVMVENPAAPEAMTGGDLDLRPVVDGRRRVLVSMSSPRRSEFQRVDPAPLLAEARRTGWRVRGRVQLPAGSTATVLLHEDGS